MAFRGRRDLKAVRDDRYKLFYKILAEKLGLSGITSRAPTHKRDLSVYMLRSIFGLLINMIQLFVCTISLEQRSVKD